MKKVMLITLLLGCVFTAIASVSRPVQPNIDEIARGQPTMETALNNVNAPMPVEWLPTMEVAYAENVATPVMREIETNRKVRDVDVRDSQLSIYKNIKALIKTNTANDIAGQRERVKRLC